MIQILFGIIFSALVIIPAFLVASWIENRWNYIFDWKRFRKGIIVRYMRRENGVWKPYKEYKVVKNNRKYVWIESMNGTEGNQIGYSLLFENSHIPGRKMVLVDECDKIIKEYFGD